MGGKQSKSQKSGSSKVFSNMITHKNLSLAQIIQPENSEPTYVQISHSVGSKQIYSRWKQNIQQSLQNNEYADSLYIPTSLQFQEKGICGHSGTIKAKYDFLPFILKDEIINRKVINQQFNQKELWYMTYIMTCAGAGMHMSDKIIGDFRPDNILISQDGQIRVCTLQTFLEQINNYQKFLTAKQPTYLAPQQIQELQSGKIDSQVNQQQAQCFSIGLTLLSVILLTDQSQLYNTKQMSFNHSQLNHQLTNLKQMKQYPPTLLSIIYGLCDYNPKSRLSCRQILQALRPYQQQILELQDFEINQQTLPSAVKSKLINNVLLGSQARGSYTKVVNLNQQAANPAIKNPPVPIYSHPSYSTGPHKIQAYEHQAMPFINQNIPPNNFMHQTVDPYHSNNMNHSLHNNYSNVTFQNANIRVTGEDRTPTVSSYHQSIPSKVYTSEASFISPRNQVQRSSNFNQISNRQSTQIYPYGSKFDSYIPPNQPFNAQMSNNANSVYLPADHSLVQQQLKSKNRNLPQINTDLNKNQGKSLLASMGRQTKSIRPIQNDNRNYNDYHTTSTFAYKQSQPKDNSDELFQSYKDIINSVDKQLQQSRKQFPEY